MEMRDCTIEVGDGLIRDWFSKLANKRGEVVMVILRPGGKVLLNTKDFYPPGVYRLPSGGMHPGETPEETLIREAQEETGFRVTIERKLAEVHWTFKIADRVVEFRSHVFLISETTAEPAVEDPNERITGFAEVEICELQDVARRLRDLTGEWRDWGVFRAIPHEIAYRVLTTVC